MGGTETGLGLLLIPEEGGGRWDWAGQRWTGHI